MVLQKLFLIETKMYNLRMNEKKFGEFIKNRRLDLRQTREVFADHVGLSASYLNAIERGTKIPSPELMVNFADYLKMKSSELYAILNDEEPQKPKSRIPDLPPDDPPLSQEKLDLLNDPRIGIMFSMNTLGQLSNRQLNQLVSQIEFFLEENEELKRLIRGNKQDGTSN